MFREVSPRAWQDMWPDNVFSLWDQRWALITAGTIDHSNTMTVGWGGLGVLWSKPVATIYIRPSRYTNVFLEKFPTFTLSFFEDSWREKLKYCGTVSGRESDKFSACGFHTVLADDQTPYIREASLVLVCKKLYWDDLEPEHMSPSLMKFYQTDGFHRMYVGEITNALMQ